MHFSFFILCELGFPSYILRLNFSIFQKIIHKQSIIESQKNLELIKNAD